MKTGISLYILLHSRRCQVRQFQRHLGQRDERGHRGPLGTQTERQRTPNQRTRRDSTTKRNGEEARGEKTQLVLVSDSVSI